GHLVPKDLAEQAVDIEDDEVLEGLGLAAQQEVTLLNFALQRIENGTYGICQKCEEDISTERLEAVPYAPLCRTCARAASA
ncbi:MAG: TraR/DksA family transcriptional regulator, partial [Pseudomonadota bacterium]